MRTVRVWTAVLVVFAMGALMSAAAQKAKKVERNAEGAMATPESVGFSSQRLERLHALIQGEIDQKQLAGAVTILARHGKIVDYRTYGARDMASGAAMTKDTIFRDYSMTKPVTGVAMMILYEEGKWLPQDPIAKYIPEFAHLKVFGGVDVDGKPILVEPEHAPTMKELMSHSAGFSYGSGHTVVDAMYQQAHVMQSANLQEMIDKLAKIPLNYQPGQGWLYSASMDIEGYIVEKLSGQSLPDFARDHIFQPLGMKDAGFFVPEEKRARFATNLRRRCAGTSDGDQSGGLRQAADDAVRRGRAGFHPGGLLPLRADAGERRRTGGAADPVAGNGAADDDEQARGESADGEIWDRPACDAAGVRVWVQLRGGLRSGDCGAARWEGDLFLGRRGGDVVLGGSGERCGVCGDDPADAWVG